MPKCPRCRGKLPPSAATGRRRQWCSDACRYAAYRKRKKPHRRAVHFSSRSDEWATPPELFAELDARHGPFDLDPCATAENAKCARHFTPGRGRPGAAMDRARVHESTLRAHRR
jgi:hypothetical protein